MNGIESWLVVLGFMCGVAALTLIGVTVIDWVVERVGTSQVQKDVDDLFRRDRARKVMRSWSSCQTCGGTGGHTVQIQGESAWDPCPYCLDGVEHAFEARTSDAEVCRWCGLLRADCVGRP